MDCGRIREDIEAFALGALDEPESRRVEAHLPGCPDCAELLRAYRTAIDHLALSVPLYGAPTRLREVVLGGIGAFRPRITPTALLKGSRWWAAVAAVLLAFAIGGVTWAVVLSSQVDGLREDNQRLAQLSQLDGEQRAALLKLQSDLNSTKSEQQQIATSLDQQATLIVLAMDPDLVPTELQGTSVAPQARCRYVWSTKQSLGALTCQNLFSISPSLTYQFWMTKGDKTVSVGTLTPRADGSASLLVKPTPEALGPVTNMFVTLETTSSVASKPSSDFVLTQVPPQQAAR